MEAHSQASLQMTPHGMTPYETVGSAPAEADDTDLAQIEVRNESELREALERGAQAVLLVDVSSAEALLLEEIARDSGADCLVEVRG